TGIAESSMLWRSSFSPLRIRYSTHGFRLVRSVPEVSKSRPGLFGSRYSAGKIVYAADNLNIRAAPNLRAEKVVLAAKGSPLTVLEEGKRETINGITAPWIKVRLSDGKEGWCFAGYVTAKKP
ncbi:SH3 domain-containing protein, partial [Treponema socranskii]|uniref:SH3 domain-containing protein n=1 Tax=Treponema socranskii TaxID=53419 RepID=UPI0028ED7EDF